MDLPVWFYIGVVSFALFGISSVFDKYILRDMPKSFNSIDVSVYKMGFDCLLLVIFMVLFSVNFSIIDVVNGGFIGFIYGVANILYYRVLQENDVNLVVPIIQGGTVVIVFVLGIYLFSEGFVYYNLIGLVILVIGVVVLYNPSKKKIKKYGLILMVLTVITISSHMVIANYYSSSSNPLALASFMYMSATLTSYSYQAAYKRNMSRFIEVVSVRKVLEIFVGSIFASIGTYLLYLSFKLGKVSYIYTLSGFQSVVILILSVLFLNESFTIKRLIGIIMIFIGISLVYI